MTFLARLVAPAAALAGHLLSLSLQVLAIVVLALILSSLLRRRFSPALGHLLWLVILLRLAVPLAPSLPGGRHREQIFSLPGLVEIVAPSVGAGGAEAAMSSSVSLWMAAALSVGWIAGMTILGFGLLHKSRRWFYRLHRESEAADEATLEELSFAAARVGVRRLPRVRRLLAGSRLPAPFLWGVVKPTLILPARTAEPWNKDEAQTVLIHELVHLRRGDHYVHLLQRWV